METLSSASKKMIILASFALFALLASSAMQVSASSANALSFGAIQNLTNNTSTEVSTGPVVATVGSNVYVAWEQKPLKGHVETEFRASSDGGATWGSTIEFNTGISGATALPGGANSNLDAVQIAASENYVYLTWKQGGQTAFAASSDSGSTFHCGSAIGACILTGAPPGKATAQAISANGQNAYITWTDGTSSAALIEEVTTNDGGVTLSTPVQLNTGASANTYAAEDESAAIGNYVYVTWDSIWFSVNNNYGAPGYWSSPVFLRAPYCTDTSGCLSREPMISASGNDVYVTFPADNSSTLGSIGNYHTYIAISHDNGATWLNDEGGASCNPGTGNSLCNPAHDLSTSISNTREIQVSSSGNNVTVTSRGTAARGSGIKGSQQYAYVSTDNGATFTAPMLLGPLSGAESGFGGVKYDQITGSVYVYWPHGTTSQLWVASCSSSCTNPSSWSAPQQVSSSTGGIVLLGDPGGSQGPMLAANNGHVYFAWEDTSTGNGDIYFISS